MRSGKNAFSSLVCDLAILIVAVAAAPLRVGADSIPPGGLGVSLSGGNMALSLVASNAQFFTLQFSPDLQQWTNIAPGIPGDGTTKSVMISNAVATGEGYFRFLVQTPIRLELPQDTAFSILGYSCGGITEHVSAGIDVVSGFPSGVVNLSTSCSTGGRGGHSVLHTGAAAVTWDFSGNVTSAYAITNSGVSNATEFTDGLGDYVYNSGTAAYLVVPIPGTPANVTAVQSGDQFEVSWLPNAENRFAIASSTLIALPIGVDAPALTNIVAGSATNGVIPTLQPQTTYQITVINSTSGGYSRASVPVLVTTSPATVPPSAPTGVMASWSVPDPSGTTDTLLAAWQAPDPGNSPIDQYFVTINGSDGAGTFTQTVSGATLSTYFPVDSTPNWTLTVQAHNAAGWGAVSTNANLGGL